MLNTRLLGQVRGRVVGSFSRGQKDTAMGIQCFARSDKAKAGSPAGEPAFA
jgi:hypothetical protein